MIAPLLLTLIDHVLAKRRIEAVVGAGLSLSLPLALGMTAMLALALVAERRRPRWTVELLGSSLAAGLLLLIAAAQTSAVVGAFSVATLAQACAVIPAVAWVVARITAMRRPGDDRAIDVEERRVDHRHVPNLVGLMVVGALGFALAAYYRAASPLPLHPAWDSFAHLRVVDGLLSGHWSLWTTDYSTTFRVNAYLPIHHLTVAMGSVIGRAAPIAVYWAGPFVVFPIVGGLAYLVARRLGASPAGAAIGGLAAILVGLPLQASAFLGLAPSTLALLFVPFVIRVVGDDRSAPELRATRLGLLILAAIAAHFAVGLAILGLVVGMLAARVVLARIRWASLALIGSALLITGLAAVLYAGVVHLPGRPPAAIAVADGGAGEHELTRARSLLVRQRDLQTRISAFVFLGAALGVLVLAANTVRRKRADGWFAATWIAALVAMFLPVVGADRAFIFLPFMLGPPLAVLISAGLRLALRPGPGLGERGLGGGAVLTALLLFAASPVVSFVDFQRSQGQPAGALTSFGKEELQAATALRSVTPGDALLVSDPISQEFVGGLANRESYGGGPYANDRELEAVRAAFGAANAEEAWSRFRATVAGTALADRLIIVFEGRTARWLTAPAGAWIGYYAQLPPYLTAASIAQTAADLADATYFVPLWRSPDVRVYAVRPGPNAPVSWLPTETGE